MPTIHGVNIKSEYHLKSIEYANANANAIMCMRNN